MAVRFPFDDNRFGFWDVTVGRLTLNRKARNPVASFPRRIGTVGDDVKVAVLCVIGVERQAVGLSACVEQQFSRLHIRLTLKSENFAVLLHYQKVVDARLALDIYRICQL